MRTASKRQLWPVLSVVALTRSTGTFACLRRALSSSGRNDAGSSGGWIFSSLIAICVSTSPKRRFGRSLPHAGL